MRVPAKSELLRRAYELWQVDPSITMPALAAKLIAEGLPAKEDTLRQWRGRYWLATPKKIDLAATRMLKEAQSLAKTITPDVERPGPAKNLQFLPQDQDAVAVPPSLLDTLDRLMMVCNNVAQRIDNCVHRVNVENSADVLTLSNALQTTVEAAALLQETSLRERGFSMKDIKTGNTAAVLTSEILPPMPIHPGITTAISAFKKRVGK